MSEASDRVARTCRLADGVGSLRYVSGRRQQAIERLGLHRVRDVLLNLPHRYLDFSQVTMIGYADVGTDATVVGTVDRVVLKRPRPRMQIVEVYVVDETGVLVATFFRQPWIAEQLSQGDVVALSGKVTFGYGFKQLKAPFYEKLGDAGARSSYARILPVHPVGEGISTSWMRRIVSAALEDAGDVCDPLPTELVARRRLLSLGRALRAVHFPASLAQAEEARRRLAYDELLTLQLALLVRRGMELEGVTPFSHRTDGPYVQALLGALPFALTGEQQTAANEILADMAAPQVMNRLLLGDVGTGKTAVALVALGAVADSGTQAAMMAPTSVLARQYAEKLGPLLDAVGISWALVTGATPPAERAPVAQSIAQGHTTCVFGTTALLSNDIEFAHLSLVVIDEQHRFGVNQRLALRQKGLGADLLTMSATPIPRTLALSVYGDIACSRITHRPRAGAGITTTVIPPENADIAYGSIREAVARGQQAYVICPLVDDRDDGSALDDVPQRTQSAVANLHSAVSTAADLARSALRGLRVEVLTGRMSADDKDDVMARFGNGEVDVLVSTTVVEVGVDVPNATVMLVFDADRFGLATLHQLRGRVGRGDVAGTVFLECAAKPQSPARQRLSALEATSDGFELAELDLRLRREGEVLGYRQHGGVTLSICDLATDADLVEAAHQDARAIARDDPRLTHEAHVPLAHECVDRFGAYFEEVGQA
ncbi:MAG: ATP-dependent DNA helicase RecG [Coriobacteriales bacterium]|nr:ATP-dependent DNA helicase RecG [Coriobacteriales bacterium]